MTVAAAYLTSEGVVLGADSTTTVGRQGGGVLQLLEHAQKVFEIGEKSRFGVCTWGDGNLGDISHRTAIARLADRIAVKPDMSVAEAASGLADLAEAHVTKARIGHVGYYLGGWDVGTHDPSCYRVELGVDKPRLVQPLKIGQCYFSGMPEFFTRVFRGYASELPGALLKRLKDRLPGKLPADFDVQYNDAFQEVAQNFLTFGLPDLPIREAIDYVHTYIHISIKALKFKFGAPSCGGPIEIAFITSDRRFRWARHKPFTSAVTETEQEGEQHGG